MRIYAKAKSREAHAGTQKPEPARQPPDVERRINAGYFRLLKAIISKPRPGKKRRSSKAGVADSTDQHPAVLDLLSPLLSAGLVAALLATGCAGVPRPLKGGKAVTTHKPAGIIEQTLLQGENPSQPTKQDQESVKVRTFTLPAGSRIEESQVWEGERPREPKLLRSTGEVRAREDSRPPGRQQPSTLNSQPSTTFVISAPMPVVEREETRARTELGAAQKDTARELGAKLSSLKGIVWVGVGLFVFGLASLVYPPLKVIIGSVTTSGALMLGGVALMVLPSLIVGNELLILGVVGVAVGGWFLAHRHGQLRGLVAASTPASAPSTPIPAPDHVSPPTASTPRS